MHQQTTDKNERQSLLKIFLVILIPVSAISCNKSSQDIMPSPEIRSPDLNSMYFPGEKIRVEAEVRSNTDFSHLELYLAETFVLETEHWSIDTLIDLPSSDEGKLLVRLIACNQMGNCNESSVEVEVHSVDGESNDTESFIQEEPEGWFLSDWTPVQVEGFEDNYALLASSGGATAITRKHFEQSGYISFYVRNGEGQLEFLVDGIVKSRWFGKEDWGEYAFTIPHGEHVFKWIGREEGSYIDQVFFTTGEERHTLGEHYGGGTIFYLDSTGLHGLIAAYEDGTYQGRQEIPWGCYGVNITSGNRAQSLSNGYANTRAIVTSCTMEQIAARYCDELKVSDGEKSWEDWYLPAVTELQVLYAHRHLLENLGGQYYWTSTSLSPHAASVIDFSDGKHHGAHRSIPNLAGPVSAGIHVRPIREF